MQQSFDKAATLAWRDAPLYKRCHGCRDRKGFKRRFVFCISSWLMYQCKVTLGVGNLAAVDTHRPSSSSFFGLPYRILNINHKRNHLEAYGYVRVIAGGMLAAASENNQK